MSLLVKAFSVFTQHPSTQIFAAPLCSNPCKVTTYIYVVLCNCTPIRWHVKQSNCGCDMTPLDPCVPSAGDIWNTVTDYREICIAGVTLPKGGAEAEGWRWERCLQPCSSAAPTTSCKQFFSSPLFVWLLLLFLEPLLSLVILTAASCSIRSSAVKAKSEWCRCEWVTMCHWVHRDCREWSENDDHRCSRYPIGAISCCHDQGLLLLCNALQCNINPEELSLAGLMKRLSRENIRLR